MTDIIVHPSRLSGRLKIPPSKSHSIRAILLASLTTGTSTIRGILKSLDTQAAIEAARQIGATVQDEGAELKIHGVHARWPKLQRPIDAQNSGLILRFMGALAALGSEPTVITGDESICTRRPVKPLLHALKQLGVKANSLKNNDHAPIQVQGPASSGVVRIEGQDSQPVSAMLMLSAFLEGETTINVSSPGEKPWIDLTLHWLDKLKVPYERKGYTQYKVCGKKHLSYFDYEVSGDFSSAAFGAALALINQTEIHLDNLDPKDPQGDKKLFDLFKKLGADVLWEARSVTLLGKPFYGTSIDVNEMIDAVPILAVLGCFAKSNFTIENAEIARYKESDRLHAITSELKKMGAKIDEKKDKLIIHPSKLNGAKLHSFFDHRIAMALVVAALNASSKSTITDVDCIAKTYPSFISDMQKLGAQIEVI